MKCRSEEVGASSAGARQRSFSNVSSHQQWCSPSSSLNREQRTTAHKPCLCESAYTETRI
eukprot:6176594-Pleurochrysis_carterae.AAC.3